MPNLETGYLGLFGAILIALGVVVYLLRVVRCQRSLIGSQKNESAREIAEQADLVEALWAGTGDGVVLLQEGKFLRANIRAQEWLGCIESELENVGFLKFVAADSSEQVGDLLRPREAGGGSFPFAQVRMVRKSGQAFDAQIRASCLMRQGRPVVLVLFHDLSFQKQSEQSLRLHTHQMEAANRQLEAAMERANDLAKRADAANRTKSEFLANMSHELRTPLTTIVGMNELLRDGAFGRLSTEQLDGLRTIESSSQHLLELINDILDLARIENGVAEIERRPVDVKSLCAACADFMRDTAERKGLTFTIDTAGAPEKLWADPRRLRQVLINLLGNAIKFTPEGGALGLIARPLEDAQGVRFTIWDTGIGISQDKMESIFQPFEQADQGLSRRHGGTGLGLAMVQRLVHMHGGLVTVHSAPGHGSQFIISIADPVSRMNLSGGHASSRGFASAESLKGLKVLLAEDDPTNARIIELQLTRRGCEVTVAFNGQDALLAASRHRPDFVIMDVQMPVMDGLKATRQLKLDPETKLIPLVCLTALAMDEDRDRCLKAGADDYITKPVDINALVGIMERLCIGRSHPPAG